MHLLVIEDERALCETIVRKQAAAISGLLLRRGEGLGAGAERYDLVLLDLNLPKKGFGMTVLRTLRQTDRQTKVASFRPQRSGGQGAGAGCRGERLSGEALPLS